MSLGSLMILGPGVFLQMSWKVIQSNIIPTALHFLSLYDFPLVCYWVKSHKCENLLLDNFRHVVKMYVIVEMQWKYNQINYLFFLKKLWNLVIIHYNNFDLYHHFLELPTSPSSEVFSGGEEMSSPNQNSTDEEKLLSTLGRTHRMDLPGGATSADQSPATFSLDNRWHLLHSILIFILLLWHILLVHFFCTFRI